MADWSIGPAFISRYIGFRFTPEPSALEGRPVLTATRRPHIERDRET
jgi:hypothetical protein